MKYLGPKVCTSLPHHIKSSENFSNNLNIQDMRNMKLYYCTLVWSISSANSLFKVENLQRRVLRFLHNDCTSSYEKLLKMSGKLLLMFQLSYFMHWNPLREKCPYSEFFWFWSEFFLHLYWKIKSSKIWNKKFEITWSKSLELFVTPYKIIGKLESQLVRVRYVKYEAI